MKKISLSDTPTKLVCGIFVLVVAAAIVAVLVLYKGTPVFFLLLSVVVAIALVYYSLGVFISGVSVSPDKKQLVIRHGLKSETMDVSAAAGVRTKPYTDGESKTRVLSVMRADGSEIGYIKTYVNMKDGAGAELIAQRLAQALELPFTPAPGLAKKK